MKCIKERLAELNKIQDEALERSASSNGSRVDHEERKVKDFLGHMLLSEANMSLEELAINTADLLSAGIETVCDG